MLSSITFILSDGGLTEGKVCEPFNSQDLISNSPYCLLNNCYDASLENLLSNRLNNPLNYYYLSSFFSLLCTIMYCYRKEEFFLSHS